MKIILANNNFASGDTELVDILNLMQSKEKDNSALWSLNEISVFKYIDILKTMLQGFLWKKCNFLAW